MRREFFCFRAIRYKKTGSISVFVLWAVAVTTMLSVGIGYRSYAELRSFRYFKDRFNGRYLVRAGFIRACDILRKDYRALAGCDSLLEDWAGDDIKFQEEHGNCRIKILDQDRKINLNYFAREAKEDSYSLNILISLLTDELAYGLIDWIDSDGMVSGMLGAESDSYYKFVDCQSRDSELKTIQELRFIKGYSDYMDIGELSEKLTVDTGDNKININTVQPEVLYSLGLSDVLITRLLDYRASGNYFRTLPLYIADIFPEFRGSDVEVEWENIKKYFKVDSQYFRISVEVETNRGLKRYAQGLVRRYGSSLKVVYFWDNLSVDAIER